jgi:hypothetical protein
MKNLLYGLAFSFSAILFLASCNPKQRPDTAGNNEIDSISFIKHGDSISSVMQQVLLANVMQATKSGGPVYAVTFCNERALPLTDSLSKMYSCQIQRISDKYRNPVNKPAKNDEAVYLKLKSSNAAEPLLVAEDGKIVYYRPIKIGMPACLNCHGVEGKEIAIKTLETIRQKYPDDLAIGYKEGDFRGLWKITFPEK